MHNNYVIAIYPFVHITVCKSVYTSSYVSIVAKLNVCIEGFTVTNHITYFQHILCIFFSYHPRLFFYVPYKFVHGGSGYATVINSCLWGIESIYSTDVGLDMTRSSELNIRTIKIVT